LKAASPKPHRYCNRRATGCSDQASLRMPSRRKGGQRRSMISRSVDSLKRNRPLRAKWWATLREVKR
ncbi:MAG: hypothetical protein V3T18_02105, partial [Pseudomonadales bacterium]